MMKPGNTQAAGVKRISAEDRQFFSLAADATFSNPFSDEREEIDLQIIGKPKGIPREDRVRLLRGRVSEHFSELEKRGGLDLRQYAAEDQEVLIACFLFDVYHRHYEDFDRHILEQIRAGEKPCPVPFARDALGVLVRRGVPLEGAKRFFAILFQVRRAYYFIEQALVGRSPCMKELRRHLWNSVFTHDVRWYERYLVDRMEDFSTLLLGETGTGKGTAAAAIGRSGLIPFDDKKGCFVESFTRSFVSINLSQYPEALIESALFGHRKGSFTGAIEDHQGVFSVCSPHGAIFLDEIGEVSVPIQIKLLQILQERIFSPVGSQEKHRFRGRVIAATNRPLGELRGQGVFRDDFFYRLCSQIITVPPLRQRLREDPGELDELLAHTIGRLTGERDSELMTVVRATISDQLSKDYCWAGNVRELEQCVRRILLTKRYDPSDTGLRQQGAQRLVEEIQAGSLSAQEIVSAYCAILYDRCGTLAEVARRTQLDRRTVKKHVEEGRHLGCVQGPPSGAP